MSKQLQKTTDVTVMKNSPKGEIQKAFSSPLVNQVGGEIIFKALNTAILKAYIATGYKAPEGQTHIGEGQYINVYEGMVNELVFWAKMNLAKLHVDEIGLAIERGAIGEYGEFMGLNKKTFVMFLRAYQKSDLRSFVVAEDAALNPPVQVIPTMDEQFATAKNNVLMAYNRYQIEKQPLGRLGSLVYDFLNSLGLIHYSKEVKEDILIRARAVVIDEKKSQRIQGDFFVREALNRTIQNLQTGPTEGTKEHSLILSKAKEITAAKYFDDVKLTDMDIEKLIDEKKAVFIKLSDAKNKL